MIDPAAETTQPIRPRPPNIASEEGSRKTPEPIMLPMTSATAIQNPMRRTAGSEGDTVRDVSSLRLVYALAHARLRKDVSGAIARARAAADVSEDSR